MRSSVVVVLVSALALSACATEPRLYVPSSLAREDAGAEVRADFAQCVDAAPVEVKGRARDHLVQTAAGGAGATAGGVLAVGGVTATAGAGGLAAAAGGASASLGAGGLAASTAGAALLLPVVVGGAVGVGLASAMIRHHREERLKEKISVCMAAKGHAVSGWTLARN